MDFEEEAALLLLLLLRRRRRRRRQRTRSLWMNELTSGRLTHGEFYTTMKNLRANNAEFCNYFSMSQSSFDHLLALIKPHIRRANTNMRRSIPAEERLAITLRYLASGCSFTELRYAFRCGTSTAQGIVNDVCKKIGQHLHDVSFPALGTGEWLNIANAFKCRANFPNCVGAIDGKHIRLIQPCGDDSTGCSSLVLMAVCDSDYKFTLIDVDSHGKGSYSVNDNSVLFQKMSDNSLNIPRDRPISTNGDPLPFVFLGDEAFPLSNNLLRPYDCKHLSQKEKTFNYRLSRARLYIESAFGILTNKWRIFQKPLNAKVENADNIIRACCVLHNFVIERDGIDLDDTLSVIGLEGDAAAQAGVRAAQTIREKFTGVPRAAQTIREKFTEYFFSEEGSAP